MRRLRALPVLVCLVFLPGFVGTSSSHTLATTPQKNSQQKQSAAQDDTLPKLPAAVWASSRIKGTPDPPYPYTTRQVFADLKFRQPTDMVRVPGTDRWVVNELRGVISSFNRTGNRDLQVSLDFKAADMPCKRLFGIVFHPEYPEVPTCFLAYAEELKSDTGVKLARFNVTDPSVPIINPESEFELMRWSSHDHSGGSLHFGPDGNLYLPIGDGQRPNPPDPSATGQDITDLQSSVLRIDINVGEGTDEDARRGYRIPADNPFVDIPSARGEIWAFGVRNPWKMCFHPTTGELWCGDVGWEMREMVHRIDKGANYGWSVMEGSQRVKPADEQYEIPITPPIVEYDHVVGRSITGGYFWNSPRLPDLKSAYIYGDWMTGRIWGVKHDGEKVTWQESIADTTLQIISFANDDDGDVLVVGYDGTIHRLVPNPAASEKQLALNGSFPEKLSETGLFQSVVDEVPAQGVLPYTINAHHWADGTYSRQWIGVVDQEQLELYSRSEWTTGDVKDNVKFPHNTVIAKTVYYRGKTGERRLETQILHRHHDDWNAYNYIWNEAQTDALLQDNVAIETEIEVASSLGDRGSARVDSDGSSESDGSLTTRPTDLASQWNTQTWLHASRDQCMLCHIWSVGTVHGFQLDQLNLNESSSANQLDRFESLGLFRTPVARPAPAVSPYDTDGDVERRARAYLDLNCAHCHRQNGGGTGTFELADEKPTGEIKLVGFPALQGDFGITDPKLIHVGDPSRSVLLYRLMKNGHGRMPQFGTNQIDSEGVSTIYQWIKSLGTDDAFALSESECRDSIGQFPKSPDGIRPWLESTSNAMVLAALLDEKEVPQKRLCRNGRRGRAVLRTWCSWPIGCGKTNTICEAIA